MLHNYHYWQSAFLLLSMFPLQRVHAADVTPPRFNSV